MSAGLRIGSLVVLLVLLGASSTAFAAPTQFRRMKFAEKSGSIVVTTNFTEVFDKEAYEDLSSGFPTTVVLRVYTYLNTQEAPVRVKLLRWRAVYDLWEETYVVRIEGLGRTKTLRIDSRVEVLRTLTQLRKFPVAGLDDIDIGPYYFLAMVIDLNPIDRRMLTEMRQWLTKSTNQSRLDSSSNFFGSFVSVFVNPKLQGADRSVRLRSQRFFRSAR